MLDFAGLNWWAILVATVAAFVLGYVWYGPVFGKAWLVALGKTEDEIQPLADPVRGQFRRRASDLHRGCRVDGRSSE